MSLGEKLRKLFGRKKPIDEEWPGDKLLPSIEPKKGERMERTITAGSSGKFQSAMLDNGQPIGLGPGATWAWTADLPSAQLTPDPADPTGATEDVYIPGTETATNFNIVAATQDPTGAAISATLNVQITSPHTYSVQLNQLT